MNQMARYLDLDSLKSKSLAFTLIFALQGCANTALNRKIDAEVAQETTVKSHADLQNEAGSLIRSAPGLSADQRAKLSQLGDSTRAQLDALSDQSLKLRSVLIKDLITTQDNDEEVEQIKQRIRDVENQRLAVTFGAIEQANLIIGHATEVNRQHILNSYFEGRGERP